MAFRAVFVQVTFINEILNVEYFLVEVLKVMTEYNEFNCYIVVIMQT